MIRASGARGPGFKSRTSPTFFQSHRTLWQFFLFIACAACATVTDPWICECVKVENKPSVSSELRLFFYIYKKILRKVRIVRGCNVKAMPFLILREITERALLAHILDSWLWLTHFVKSLDIVDKYREILGKLLTHVRKHLNIADKLHEIHIL